MLIGFILGVCCGICQFALLSIFVNGVTKAKLTLRMAVLGFVQLIIPLAVLVLCALLWRSQLLYVGIGMASAIIVCAVVKMIIRKK